MARRREKEGSKLKGLIAFLVIFGLIGGGAFFAYRVLWDSYGHAIMDRLGMIDDDYEGEGTGEVLITIYEGDIGIDIANTLEEADVVKTADAFYKLLLSKPDIEFFPGSYQLRSQMSAESALALLTNPENRLDRTVLIREGLTDVRTFQILADTTGIPEEDFFEAAKDLASFQLPKGVETLEGWLFPALYEFELDVDAKGILLTLVNAQKENLAALGVAEENQQEILTIASVIEKEAGIAEDFALVSNVIYNRLEVGMKLEMDSTAQYGVGEHEDGNVWSSEEALTSENPWNTYVHTGLPATPIANPGFAAIQAAVSPAAGDWLFFVVAPGGTGHSTFTTNIADHDAATAEYRAWCEATPDSGC